MKTLTLVLILLFVPLRVTAEERWFIFSIAGTPVGWAVEDVDGPRTRLTISARLTRLGKRVDMRFETVTTEDAAGVIETVEYEAKLSAQPMRLVARVDGDRVLIATPPHERAIDRGTAPLLGPQAIARLSAARLRAAGDLLEYATFSPELQRVVAVRRQVEAVREPSPCGPELATRLDETMAGLPTPRTLWIDADGAMIGDSVNGPFGAMTTCRAPKEAALAAAGTLPADLFERTLARSNVRFADPSAIDRLVLRVRPRDSATPLPDFSAHNQRVLGDGLVEVRRASIERGAAADAASPGPEFVQPNALVESDHPDVVRIAEAQTTADPFATALALTTWTAEHLTLDAGIVMAPASELVRDRRATCMGYATLLAALARAAGLPSRVAMGYVYYGGIWGGHAWTEMFVDGRWLPFDAAVYAPGIAGAARVSVGASSLTDGVGALTGPLSLLFGRVDVETVEYEAGGRTTRVEDGARPFEVSGSTYLNPGLGLRVDAEGWQVERADATWPSTLVVAFRRGGILVELHQRPGYPVSPLARTADAMFVSADGGTLWVWTAQGPGAAEGLRMLLSRVQRDDR